MRTEVFKKKYDADLEESELSTAIGETSIDEVQTDVEESTDVKEDPVVIKVLPDLIIDEIIKDRIPLLTEQEYLLLEKSILADGCRDSLITWNTATLADGINRYAICKKHNIPFKTIDKQFKNLEEVLDWVDDNQLGKRNLTTDGKAIIIGRKYNREKGEQGGDRKSKGQNVHLINVAKKFADEYNINEKTVKRYGKIATEYEEIKAKNPLAAKDIFSGKIKFKDVKKPTEKKPKKPTEKKPTIPPEKKAPEQPLSTGGTPDPLTGDSSTQALETGASSKEIVIEAETPKGKFVPVLNEHSIENKVDKVKNEVLKLQKKRSDIAKKIVANQKLTATHTDKDDLAKDEEEVKKLTAKSDGFKYDIEQVLAEYHCQTIFNASLKKVKGEDYKGLITL